MTKKKDGNHGERSSKQNDRPNRGRGTNENDPTTSAKRASGTAEVEDGKLFKSNNRS